MRLTDLETPALVLDLDLFEQNLDTMDHILEGSSAKLRPHYKSHKCPALAKIQMERGAKGITCAKLGEAETLVEAGFPDILIANEVVQPQTIAKLAYLARKTKLTVCVDSAKNIQDLQQAAALAGSTIHCYVEYNAGLNRCGVSSFQEAYDLARQVQCADHLTFDGIQAYAGQLSHEEDEAARLATVRQVEQTMGELKAYLEERGLPVREISGASSATCAWKAQGGVYTELQAGSYIFMDQAFGGVHLPFQRSLTVLTTVLSRNSHNLTVDAGAKSFGLDQKEPVCVQLPDCPIRISEEHITLDGENLPYQVGEQLSFYPGHCCTTVNTFDFIYFKRGEQVVGRAPIAGRGKAQ